MNVADLIKALQQFPPDAPVLFTWEGVLRSVELDAIYTSRDGVVLLDADFNGWSHYKNQWQETDLQNEN